MLVGGRSEVESCLHLNCSALRLFNLIVRLHFIEPGRAGSPGIGGGAGLAGPPCSLPTVFCQVLGGRVIALW